MLKCLLNILFIKKIFLVYSKATSIICISNLNVKYYHSVFEVLCKYMLIINFAHGKGIIRFL